jgi:hypothetical protein
MSQLPARVIDRRGHYERSRHNERDPRDDDDDPADERGMRRATQVHRLAVMPRFDELQARRNDLHCLAVVALGLREH